jgi:hypothetical protein
MHPNMYTHMRRSMCATVEPHCDKEVAFVAAPGGMLQGQLPVAKALMGTQGRGRTQSLNPNTAHADVSRTRRTG